MTQEQLVANLQDWWAALSPELQDAWRRLSQISQEERPKNPQRKPRPRRSAD